MTKVLALLCTMHHLVFYHRFRHVSMLMSSEQQHQWCHDYPLGQLWHLPAFLQPVLLTVTNVAFKIIYFCFSCPFYMLDKGWSSWLKQVLRGLVPLLWGLTNSAKFQQTDLVYCTSDMHLSLTEKVDKMGGARQVFYLSMAAGTTSEAYNQEKGVSRHYSSAEEKTKEWLHISHVKKVDNGMLWSWLHTKRSKKKLSMQIRIV